MRVVQTVFVPRHCSSYGTPKTVGTLVTFHACHACPLKMDPHIRHTNTNTDAANNGHPPNPQAPNNMMFVCFTGLAGPDYRTKVAHLGRRRIWTSRTRSRGRFARASSGRRRRHRRCGGRRRHHPRPGRLSSPPPRFHRHHHRHRHRHCFRLPPRRKACCCRSYRPARRPCSSD